MKLTGSQSERLHNALRLAFPSVENLERMARFKLNINLHEIGYGDLSNYVFRLIQWAEAQGILASLVNGARQSNPGNLEILDIAQEFNLDIDSTPSKRELQRIIKETNCFLDINDWRLKLSAIEFQVCRIEIKLDNQSFAYGTGFLIGPDIVITNYHVMKFVIEKKNLKLEGKRWADIEDVTLRFDYKLSAEKQEVNTGTEFHLLPADWLFDSSPTGPLDSFEGECPDSDQLDYAILRVEGSPGSASKRKNDSSQFKRGWVRIPQEAYDFLPDSTLIIVQHPEAQPLKLAIDTQGIIGLNENGTRIKYRTNTEPGSSGSPCFNVNWELVALHHAGDPNYSMEHSPVYNQGIPFGAICELLRKRNLLGDLQN